MAMGANATRLQDLFDPEVLAPMISAELEKAIRFLPLANVDRTLEGRPGSTLTLPKWGMIADAEDVAEGQDVPIRRMGHTTEQVTIKKVGNGVELTDEAVLSGYGDPIGEANRQIAMSIANKVDNDVLDALKTTSLTGTVDGYTADNMADLIDLFMEEDMEGKVILVPSKGATPLRKDLTSRNTDFGDQVLIRGSIGTLHGAQVVVSNKLADGEGAIVKPGALSLYMKRNVQVETDRDIIAKVNYITADQHYMAHLYDESKAIFFTVGA